MTDLEKFIDTYKQFGIDVKTFESEGKIIVNLNGWEDYSTESDKFGGYGSFFSEVQFTKEGKFLGQDFWE
jgi:hypothetical protein